MYMYATCVGGKSLYSTIYVHVHVSWACCIYTSSVEVHTACTVKTMVQLTCTIVNCCGSRGVSVDNTVQTPPIIVVCTMALLCNYGTYTYSIVCCSAGAVVLLAIGLLSQFFHYIPETALAAIIIAAVLPMVDVRILYKIYRIRGVCVCVCVCTCIYIIIRLCCVFFPVLDDIPLVVAFLFTLILGIEVCVYVCHIHVL